MKQNKNNKGFSLVELIVVIAIMIVLVAVLAPVFTKYVEQSRRATDVQNANTIASAVLTDAADENCKFTATAVALTEDNLPTSIKSVPEVKGKLYDNAKFYVAYDESKNQASVFVGTDAQKSDDLTDETNAKTYKDAEKTKSE